mgnify:CR=1 FL=1
MGKYSQFDPSPEAVEWRRRNKKHVRPLVKKKKSHHWMFWVAIAIIAMASIPLALVFGLLVTYMMRSEQG